MQIADQARSWRLKFRPIRGLTGDGLILKREQPDWATQSYFRRTRDLAVGSGVGIGSGTGVDLGVAPDLDPDLDQLRLAVRAMLADMTP